MDKQLQPKLRFPEFSEDLRNSNIKNEFSIFNGYAFKSEDSVKSGIRWIKIADVGINRIEENNICYLPEYFENQYKKFLLKKGDIVVALTRPILGNKLKIAKIDSNSADSLLNQRVGKLISKNNLKYIYYFLQTQKSISTISNNIAGTDPPNLSPSEINHIKFYIPSLTEQQKIADYLTTIDKKIELLEEKKTELSRYKKAMMQKLFSQDIRFKDEDGNDYPEWEEKRLKNFLIHVSKRNKRNEVQNVLSVSNTKGFISQSEQFEKHRVASKDVTNYKIVSKGEFAYNPSRINIGSIALLVNYDQGIVSPMYVVFKLNDKLNPHFFNNLIKLKSFNDNIKKWSSGSVRESLNFEDLIMFKYSIPSIPEQQKIADFFSAIDESITKVEEQIKETQNFKKAMLQQLFV